MTAPSMRTLRVRLVDIEMIPASVVGTVKGGIWVRLTQHVRTTDGKVIGLAQIWRDVGTYGVIDFRLPVNDDAGTVLADRGFGAVVGWDLTARGPGGSRIDISHPGTTVYITSAAPAVMAFPTLDAVTGSGVYGSPYGSLY